MSGISRTSSDGMPIRSSSTSGKRSRVAKRGRPSTTTVRNPSVRPRLTSGIATCPPPPIRRVPGGARNPPKDRPPPRNKRRGPPQPRRAPPPPPPPPRGGPEQLGAGSGRLEPREEGRPPPGRRMRPRALVEEERPIARAVQGHRLDEHLDGPAAGQPALPGPLIAQAELEQAGGGLPPTTRPRL